MIYKVGDKVRIVSKVSEELDWNNEMDTYLGKVMTVEGSFYGRYKMAEDEGKWYWDDSMIAGLASEVPFDFGAWKYKNVCMHCKTREEAEDFCNEMHKAGLTWSSGRSYLSGNRFESHEEQTCYYFNEGKYDSTVYAKNEGYTILEWSEYRSTEPKEEQEKTMAPKSDDKPLSYQEAVKIRKMICRKYDNCTDCPLDEKNNGLAEFCRDAFGRYPNKTEKILKKWKAEHPVLTNEQKCNEMFLEVFGMQYATALMLPDWWQQEYIEPYKEKE